MKKIIIYIIIVAIVVAAGIFVAIKLTKGEEARPTSQEVTNQIVNETNNMIENEINNRIENNNIQNNNIGNNEVQDNETNQNNSTSQVQEPKTDEEKAIAIVKKEWGADDSVKFVVEDINNNGEYVISVRDKNTTAAIEWYTVNLTTNTCDTM